MNNKYKTIAIFFIMIIVCTLTMGYSAFGRESSISDIVAEVRVVSDIRVTGISVVSSSNGVVNNLDYDEDSIVGNINLKESNSSVTLQVSVTNFGNTEMGIYAITGLSDNLYRQINGYTLQEKLCDRSGSCSLGSITTFDITIGYDNYDAVTKNHDIRLDFDFRKMHKITYTGITNNGYPISVIDGGDLEFTATSNVPSKIVAFNSLGNRYDYDSYSYINGKFIFNCVSGDINLKYQAKSNLAISAGSSHFKESDYVSKIKNVEFVDYIDEKAIKNALKSYDLSSEQDKSIIGWIDSNYKLWIGSDWIMYAKVLNEYFYNMSAVESIIFNNINTSSVYTMYRMFSGCSSLKTIDLSKFNTVNVNSIHGLFTNCSSLTSIIFGDFKTSKVSTFLDVFNGCSSLTSLNLSSFDTSNATVFQGMFANASALKSLDLSNFNTSKGTNFYGMFLGCSSLTKLDLSNFNTSSATSFGTLFRGCHSLEELDLSGFNTSNVTRMEYMFAECRKLSELDLSHFVTSKVTAMEYMFYDMRELVELNISSFDTSNTANMKHMFHDAFKIKRLDLSHFNTSKVTEMASMFQNARALDYLDVSLFDTSKVTRMDYMFNNTLSLEQLDLQSFNTAALTNANYMFSGTSLLSKILVSNNWSLSSSCKTTNMFLNSGVSKVTYV